MTKWLLVVETNCNDATREAVFNNWYDNIHLPDVLETPGFIRATRYENTDTPEGRGKFLATYEIETDDIKQTMKAMGENLGKKRAEGRMIGLIELVSSGYYKQISSRSQ